MAQLITGVILSLVLPFAVQLIKTEAMTGTPARVLAIIVSIVAGVATGFVGGLPADPSAWLTCIFAMVGGVQTAYALFRGVGITDKVLDALLGVNLTGSDE